MVGNLADEMSINRVFILRRWRIIASLSLSTFSTQSILRIFLFQVKLILWHSPTRCSTDEIMAFERQRRRLSTDSDQSSTSTTYSTESTKNYRSLSPSLSFASTSTSHPTSEKTQRTHSNKRGSNLASPAELLLARTKNTFLDLNPYFQCLLLPR